MDNSIRIVPVGGCGEIGINMTLLEWEGHRIAVDCGVLFPGDDLPGVDAVSPDMNWLSEKDLMPEAIFVTHGHEDHIGALPALLKKYSIPVYAAGVTLELIREKMGDIPFTAREFLAPTEFCGITAVPVLVSHSVPDSIGILFETRHGNVFFSGDFRMRDGEALRAAMGGRKVRLMLADSTNAMTPGKEGLEEDLLEPFVEIMKETSGTVVFISFASSIWRHKSILDAAELSNRQVFALGRSVQRNMAIGKRCGVLKGTDKMQIEEDALSSLEKGRLCVLASGSQGELYSGAFRLAQGHVKGVKLGKGDTVVFSSRTIPGNERSVNFLLNHFARLGTRIITPRERKVHVSGHGFREELRDAIKILNPEFYAPIHGEYRHLLSNGDIAREEHLADENVFMMRNGLPLSLDKLGCRLAEEPLEIRRVHMMEGIPCEPSLARERVKLAEAGLVVASYVLRNGALWGEPVVEVRGLPLSEELVLKEATRVFEYQCEKGIKLNVETIREELRISLRSRLAKILSGLKPNVYVILHTSS